MRKRVLTLWDGKVFLALVVLMGCILAGIASYQHVYMKTPDYAVSQVIRAARDEIWKPSAATSMKGP